jgi:hypothetical protein
MVLHSNPKSTLVLNLQFTSFVKLIYFNANSENLCISSLRIIMVKVMINDLIVNNNIYS